MQILEPIRTQFRAIARTVVPEAAVLDEPGWAELEGIVENALSARPVRLVRQLRLFIRVIDAAALLCYGARFAAVDRQRRTSLLRRFERAPFLLLRRGVWGLRTLVLMGYYARPAAAEDVGYRATPAGWSARQ